MKSAPNNNTTQNSKILHTQQSWLAKYKQHKKPQTQK